MSKRDTGKNPSPDDQEVLKVKNSEFESDNEKKLADLDRELADLDRENVALIAELQLKYVELIRTLNKEDPLHLEVVSRINELRGQKNTIEKKNQPDAETEVDFIFPERLFNKELLSTRYQEEFIDVIDELKQIKEEEGSNYTNFDRFYDKLIRTVNKRVVSVFKNPDQASTITALRGLGFELSRMLVTLKQNLGKTKNGESLNNEIDFSGVTEGVRVEYTGYRRGEMDYEHQPSHLKRDGRKGVKIEFDVPLVRNGMPYVFETKSSTRKIYGESEAAVNQALKYQAAIDQGLVAGATIEVRGRMSVEYLGWAMGQAIDDPGNIPSVEIIYNLPLPSGKEYRFVLKRGMKMKDLGGKQVMAENGLDFHNEERYGQEDMDVIKGVGKTLADKSIRDVLSKTQISDEQIEKERKNSFSREVNTKIELTKTIEELFAYQGLDQKRVNVILRRVFPETSDEKKHRKRTKEEKNYTPEVVLENFSDLLGYDVSSDPQKAANDIWRLTLSNPEKITSAKMYEIYDTLRLEALHEGLKDKSGVINVENRKSAVSEHANREYVEADIRSYLDYLSKNPEIAKAKGQYIISEENIPEAIDRVMKNISRIARYEQNREKDKDEEGEKDKRKKMGYTGKSEGVALDIEHIIVDVLYGMNKKGQKAEELQRFFSESGLETLFVSGGGGDFFPKFRTEEDFIEALQSDDNVKALVEFWGDRAKASIKKYKKLVKESAFVRSYEWPERFEDIKTFVDKIAGADRRYQELKVFDPVKDKISRQIDTNDVDIERTKSNIVKENVTRAREWLFRDENKKHTSAHKKQLAGLELQLQDLESEKIVKIDSVKLSAKAKVGEINKTRGLLQSEQKRLRGELKASEEDLEKASIRQRIEGVEMKLVGLQVATREAFAEVQENSDLYQNKMAEVYAELEKIYREKVIPGQEWGNFAMSIPPNGIIDQNIMKVIYTVSGEGEVVVQEEVLRGQVTGRAAHSELAQGRNVYGAGELAFERVDGSWQLVEVNNGSGHYRPDADSNLHYVRNLIAEKGVDISNTALKDCLFRGRKVDPGNDIQPATDTHLREASLF